MIEQGSVLMIDEVPINITEDSKVKDMLYGEKYGKAS